MCDDGFNGGNKPSGCTKRENIFEVKDLHTIHLKILSRKMSFKMNCNKN